MKIIQVVQYIEANHAFAEGTVVLCEDGCLYRAEFAPNGILWAAMTLPPLPDPIQRAIDAGPPRPAAGLRKGAR